MDAPAAASNVEIARRFVAAVERSCSRDELASFMSDDVEQHELPNRLFPEGVRRDLATLLTSSEKGAKVLRSQTYDIVNIFGAGSHVAIEMKWKGVLAVPLGKLVPGDALTGQFAFFIEIEDGKIRRMRNYDCYDPF